jgi:capsule polysaccharide export protein KpsE/RkpR
MTEEPASLILELLRQMRAELASKDEVLAMRAEVSDLRSEVGGLKSGVESLGTELKSDMHTLRADVAADLLSTRKELSEQIVGLRRAVIEYHTSVIGHGVLISELEARVRRVEQHLNLPSLNGS